MVGVTDTQVGDAGNRVHVALDTDEPLSTHVAEAVADAAGDEVDALDVDLYGAIEPDALDTLHRHARRTDATWELAFDVADSRVRVSSDGTVTVD